MPTSVRSPRATAPSFQPRWLSNVTLSLFLTAVLPATAGAGLLDVSSASAFAGLGLEVTLGACNGPDDLVLGPPGPITGDFVACDAITAGGGVTVESNASLVAGDHIVLQEGFSIGEGAVFRAEVSDFLKTPFAYVRDDSPSSESRFNAIFYVRLDSLNLGSSDEIDHFVAYRSNGEIQFRLYLRHNATTGQDVLGVVAREDGGGMVDSSGSETALSAGWNRIELSWRARSGNGYLRTSVNDSLLSAQTTALDALDNASARVDYVRWGAVSGSVASSSGSLECDEYWSFR